MNKNKKMSTAVLKKKMKQQELAERYKLEREFAYTGDESFMNTLHPFEETGKDAGKKSSPLQKAIITCIKENNGSASEEQILEYIKTKWDIITRLSERQFLDEPSIRIVRLNCAIKKKGRHLFLKDPTKPGNWMLNTTLRKSPIKRQTTSAKYISTDSDMVSSDDEEEEEKIDYTNKSFKTQVIESDDTTDSNAKMSQFYMKSYMKEETFEYEEEMFIKNTKHKISFQDICQYMKPFQEMPGLFHNLPFERRVKACLTCLISEGVIEYDKTNNEYIPNYPNKQFVIPKLFLPFVTREDTKHSLPL